MQAVKGLEREEAAHAEAPAQLAAYQTDFIDLRDSVILRYYSLTIFSRFTLAKSTCLVHHNQLLMTKFKEFCV